jgi:hypothetical protein
MSLAIKQKAARSARRLGLKQRFGDPKSVLEMMSDFIREGDIAAITDLIAAYVSNSPLYKSQEEFAQKIGTTRQTLHRMLSHSETVSLGVFFKAIEQIHSDAEGF